MGKQEEEIRLHGKSQGPHWKNKSCAPKACMETAVRKAGNSQINVSLQVIKLQSSLRRREVLESSTRMTPCHPKALDCTWTDGYQQSRDTKDTLGREVLRSGG